MDLQLKGKRALVTGGSRGIGKAVALALAQEGTDVALMARDASTLAAAAAELMAATGRTVVGVVADTRDDAAVQAAVAEAAARLGGTIDILVNAAAEPAGYAGPPKLGEITGAYFQGELDTKVMGYIRCSQAVVPGMRAAGWGRIVHISGLAARQAGNTVGSIRNVAVAALAKNMADELGPAGVQVTVVQPGITRTERTAPLVAARAAAQGLDAAAVEAQMAAGNSIGASGRRDRGGLGGGLPLLAPVAGDQRRCGVRGRWCAAGDPLLMPVQGHRPVDMAAQLA